jgi:hypothetical protein
MELNDLKDNVITKENFISFDECIQWLQKVPAPFLLDNENLDWKYRTIDITTHSIVQQVEDYWNNYFKTDKLKISQAQIQLWPIKSYSVKHIHNANNREGTNYNSMLYLNNNYMGGEFFTDKITLKPKPGMLTFFDGQKTYHGVKPVYWNNRYTIIFWFG